jgi:hypothetical protein
VFIIIFIGSRVAKFSDGEQRGEMDAVSKWINALSIVFGAAAGIGSAWSVPLLSLNLTFNQLLVLAGLCGALQTPRLGP